MVPTRYSLFSRLLLKLYLGGNTLRQEQKKLPKLPWDVGTGLWENPGLCSPELHYDTTTPYVLTTGAILSYICGAGFPRELFALNNNVATLSCTVSLMLVFRQDRKLSE